MDDQTGRQADPAAVDAVLTASRAMVAVATRSLGAAAEETTIAQYRALVVLASRGPRRIAGLAVAEAFREFADAAGEVPDSQWPIQVPAVDGPVPHHRAPAAPGRLGLPVMPARGSVQVKEKA
jgi:hypothetical protein